MGQDKALLAIQGQPLLQRIYGVAAEVCVEVAVISPWPKRYQALLPKACHFIQEPCPEAGVEPPGPLVGFLKGMEETRTASWMANHQENSLQDREIVEFPWVLLLACDLPRLNAEPLQQAISHLSKLPPTVMALVPKNEKGWEPLCGFYRWECLSSLQEFVQEGGRSFQTWLQRMVVHPWDLEDQSVLFNCNTLRDLEILKSNDSQTS